MDTLKLLLGKLNGRKMAAGIALVVIGGFITLFDPVTGQNVTDIGWTLSGLGALHKIWKGT